MDLHSVMDISNATMNLLDPSMVVNNIVIILISAIVGIFVAIIIFKYKWKKAEVAKQKEKLEQEQNKEAERKNEKRILTGRLLSEIYRNQKMLEPLYTAAEIFESDERNFSEYIKIPNELKFNRSIYSDSSDKLGLLDDESRKLIDNYYPELSDIENEFEKLDLIHGASHEYLLGYLVLWNTPGHLDYDDNFLGGDEIVKFLRHAKKVYDLGAELIISLKDNTGCLVSSQHQSVRL